MPLRDHFAPPFSNRYPWDGMHSAWANALVIQLNEETLPPQYHAIPTTHLGLALEIDVATVELAEAEHQAEGNGTVAVWAPPRARLAAVVDFTDRDTFEILVREGDGDRLVAAIELVSPANKDRPSSRRDFMVKCASYLQHSVALVVVDAITAKPDNLHHDLMRFLDLPDELVDAVPSSLSAIAYRTRRREDKLHQLELWPQTLAIGMALPTVPLWIAEDRAVPVDLEASYQAASRALRIR